MPRPGDFKQGDIFWTVARDLDVAGNEQDLDRPYVIVSRNALNNLCRNVVGVPLTTKLHKAGGHRVLIPDHQMIAEIGSGRRLETSVALTDHIRVLDPQRFERPRMGRVTETALGGIENGIAWLFDVT